jgi:hypothetical protein
MDAYKDPGINDKMFDNVDYTTPVFNISGWKFTAKEKIDLKNLNIKEEPNGSGKNVGRGIYKPYKNV